MSEVRLAAHGGYVFVVKAAITPHQTQLVQESLTALAPRAEELAHVFYSRLFEERPHLRALFPPNLEEQKKKLIKMLVLLVNKIEKIEEISPEIYELGRRHHSYDVTPQHYVYVGDALIWALHRILGSSFTPELRDAWLAVYRMVAQVMQELGQAPRDVEKFYREVVLSVLDGQYGISAKTDAEEPNISIVSSDAGDKRSGRKRRRP